MALAVCSTEPVSVLAAGTASGQRMELVLEPDGFLAITLDGLQCQGCRWPAAMLEECVSLYLTLLRNRSEQ
jgi:hypothetical protein